MHLFFMENNITMIIIWLVAFIILLGIELSTTQLVSIWFCGGAFISLILACFDVPWQVQTVVFVVISILLLIITKPIINKKFNSVDDSKNINTVVGTHIYLTKDVSKEKQGEGKIRDVVWTCKTNDENPLLAGEKVEIVDVSGNSLFVTKIK